MNTQDGEICSPLGYFLLEIFPWGKASTCSSFIYFSFEHLFSNWEMGKKHPAA